MSATPCRVCGAQTRAFLCRACAKEITDALGDWPSYLHELSILATGQTKVYRANGRGGVDEELAELEEEYAWRQARIPAHLRSRDARTGLPATRSMVNPYARDLLAEASNMLVTWARHLAEHRGVDWPALGLCTVADVQAWLLTNVEAFRFDEAGVEAHRELLHMLGRMRRAVDRAPSRVYAGPCGVEGDGCRRPLFAMPQPSFDTDHARQAWEDDNPIVCDGYRPAYWRDHEDADYGPDDEGCGKTHARDARREWMLADVEDRLLRWSVIEDVLPSIARDLTWPTQRTWQRWRAQLVPHTVRDGVEFYRGGDVLELCRREQQRIIGNRARGERAREGRLAG